MAVYSFNVIKAISHSSCLNSNDTVAVSPTGENVFTGSTSAQLVGLNVDFIPKKVAIVSWTWNRSVFCKSTRWGHDGSDGLLLLVRCVHSGGPYTQVKLAAGILVFLHRHACSTTTRVFVCE